MQTAGQIGVAPRTTENQDRLRVTVHVADQLTRAGLLSHLGRADVQALGPVGPGADLSGLVAVVVSDRLDELTLAELRRLVRGGKRPVVLVIGQLREPELVSVLECGVQTILWRHQATPERLAQAIRAAARGESGLPPDLLGQVLSVLGRVQRAPSGAPAPALRLAPREVDVLSLIANGLETRQIADQLAYSERTVKNILHGLMSRLQLTNRAHAVAWALREGYL